MKLLAIIVLAQLALAAPTPAPAPEAVAEKRDNNAGALLASKYLAYALLTCKYPVDVAKEKRGKNADSLLTSKYLVGRAADEAPTIGREDVYFKLCLYELGEGISWVALEG
ncbi:hypothetical protein B0H67DRAFT_648150 [Lasiosphaeris hirsuta]|uniref:Uncharacterized protein n=1 Tax=Lasiosphaeris hirsuta TaxID=260670 RepID=A0AA40A2T4_9PEZI|nr:hypothetical protein B0H67DRAFT_648150 [Lasiosphaeris hirsuta]